MSKLVSRVAFYWVFLGTIVASVIQSKAGVAILFASA